MNCSSFHPYRLLRPNQLPDILNHKVEAFTRNLSSVLSCIILETGTKITGLINLLGETIRTRLRVTQELLDLVTHDYVFNCWVSWVLICKQSQNNIQNPEILKYFFSFYICYHLDIIMPLMKKSIFLFLLCIVWGIYKLVTKVVVLYWYIRPPLSYFLFKTIISMTIRLSKSTKNNFFKLHWIFRCNF